jgi:hypothetical protein
MSQILLASFFLVVSCALFQPWQVAYLKTGANHVTMEEVAQRMGPPCETETSVLASGGTVWRYRNCEYQAGDLEGPGRWWCDNYKLSFDKDHILRQWHKNTTPM